MLSNPSVGRSDRVRTCDLDVPNVARYQLRYTSIKFNYFIYTWKSQFARTGADSRPVA